MEQGRALLRITPAACIFFALSVILLPLEWVLSWLGALMVHEGAHILAVKICGGRIHRIRFGLAGAQIVADTPTTGLQIICALAGPLGGLLLLALLRRFPKAAICACIQSVCNLMPLLRSDGGQALDGFLCLLLPQEMANKICLLVDRIMRIILCVLGLYAAWRLSWGLLAALSCVLLLRGIKNTLQTKSPAGTIKLTEAREV